MTTGMNLQNLLLGLGTPLDLSTPPISTNLAPDLAYSLLSTPADALMMETLGLIPTDLATDTSLLNNLDASVWNQPDTTNRDTQKSGDDQGASGPDNKNNADETNTDTSNTDNADNEDDQNNDENAEKLEGKKIDEAMKIANDSQHMTPVGPDGMAETMKEVAKEVCNEEVETKTLTNPTMSEVNKWAQKNECTGVEVVWRSSGGEHASKIGKGENGGLVHRNSGADRDADGVEVYDSVAEAENFFEQKGGIQYAVVCLLKKGTAPVDDGKKATPLQTGPNCSHAAAALAAIC